MKNENGLLIILIVSLVLASTVFFLSLNQLSREINQHGLKNIVGSIWEGNSKGE